MDARAISMTFDANTVSKMLSDMLNLGNQWPHLGSGTGDREACSHVPMRWLPLQRFPLILQTECMADDKIVAHANWSKSRRPMPCDVIVMTLTWCRGVVCVTHDRRLRRACFCLRWPSTLYAPHAFMFACH